MPDKITFTSLIEDHHLGERFSAEVSVNRPGHGEKQRRKPALVHVYITPVSGRLFSYRSSRTWEKTPMSFFVGDKWITDSHCHFIVYDRTGHGLYKVRDPQREDVHERECSIWDLGETFGSQVAKAIDELI